MTSATLKSPAVPELLAIAINAELKRLRASLCLHRHMVRQSRNCHWGWWPTAERERYEQIQRLKLTVKADEIALQNHISEYREMMGSEWIGNKHGRLCWASYLGGKPIEQHYCAEAEGHDGNHCCDHGAWEPHRCDFLKHREHRRATLARIQTERITKGHK